MAEALHSWNFDIWLSAQHLNYQNYDRYSTMKWKNLRRVTLDKELHANKECWKCVPQRWDPPYWLPNTNWPAMKLHTLIWNIFKVIISCFNEKVYHYMDWISIYIFPCNRQTCKWSRYKGKALITFIFPYSPVMKPVFLLFSSHS